MTRCQRACKRRPCCSVDAFVARCREQAEVTRGGDIMLTIGSDFQFANAHLQ